ncbi:MAG: terpene cyclase/mutase family protein [Thermoguttaceae bacterium]|nr:terpene cyclase/mutase family protein [Thermoguttaceae bacterium]
MKSPTESDAPRFEGHEDPWGESGVAPFIDTGAFDFLPKSEETVTEVPVIVTEVEPGDPLTERLEAILSHTAGPDVELKTLFEQPPWFLRMGEILLSRRGIGSLTSILLHLLLLILLAIWGITIRNGSRGEPLQVGFSDEGDISMFDDLGDETELFDFTVDDPQPDPQEAEYLPKETPQNQFTAEISQGGETVPDLNALDRDGGGFDTLLEGFETSSGQKATSGRTAAIRRHGLPGREGDTTDASEAAVEAGLAWLAAHQLPDGGWAFDLTSPDDNGDDGECQGKCSNSHATSGANQVRNGLYPGRMAATGIALLAFLGAGYDHKTPGVYRETVDAGLRYIKYRARQTKAGLDFRESGERYGMYTHAIVTVTVCEAYELTEDPELKTLARDGALFIVNSQRDDGGWRYEAAVDPNFFSYSPGDTSVSGWQMLALKSAMSAGFACPPEVFYKAGFFLDSVQSENNTLFRYMVRTNESESKMWGTTAVGVLMREYIGWKQRPKYLKQATRRLSGWFNELYDNWKLAKKGRIENRDGVAIVSEGRFRYNLYFAYYASIALHHAGGSVWHKCYAKTRDFLIETQNRGDVNPHEKGSWLFYDRYLNDGGRLLNTAISVLILETPYRYLPMYK